MKTFSDIQYAIRDKDKIHIIIDFEKVVSSLNTSYSLDLFSPIYKRIFENFAKKDFIDFTILIDKKDKRFRSKSIYKNSNINFVDLKEFKEKLETLAESEFDPVYIGYDKDIVKFFKRNKLFSIGIALEEKLKKSYVLAISKDTFEKFLTETNNLYL